MEEIKAYKPKCCKKAYIRKQSAIRHEKKCCYNPDNKACATCGHRNKEYHTFDDDYDVTYDWCDALETGLGAWPASHELDYQFNCKHWIPKAGGD